MKEFWVIFTLLLASGAAGFFLGLFVASFKERRLKEQIGFLEMELDRKKERVYL